MARQRKPYDVGNGLLCASFGLDGSWLSVGAPHPRAAFVELGGAPAFPADRDGEVDLVRAHRAQLTDPATAILRILGTHILEAGDSPVWLVRGDDWEARAEAWAEPHRPTVVQRHVLRSAGAGLLQIVFQGRLDRPGYAEITPGGPIPDSLPVTRVEPDGQSIRVRAGADAVAPVATIEITSPSLRVGNWVSAGEGASLTVAWDEVVTDAQLVVSVSMSCGEQGSPRGKGWSSALSTRSVTSPLDRIEDAAVRYTLGCTAMEVADGQCCIISDHRLLPLSWTRDAYYQAALLLTHVQDLPDAADVVGRHLSWLWRTGRDARGVWRRSHLTTGAVKDTGYQVDQQLFPILELIDYRRTIGTWPTWPPEQWGSQVRRVWNDLPRDDNGLVPGEENPADDPSAFPYLLSSQLLLVHVARRLAEFDVELGLEDLDLSDDAERTLELVRTTFTCQGPFGAQWAYEADGSGGYRLYHDANDVPTALAPLWGLCDATDPTWRATMQFAFSEHNPGFVAGSPGGLGSAHTSGVWPLGDAQEWAVAVAKGDRARVDAVINRIGNVASADGMLPETYRADSSEWLARHWFAWPGSLVGLLNATFHHGRGPWTGVRV